MEGLELKIMRIRKGIKSKELAAILGVSGAYISMVENNKEIASDDLHKRWTDVLNENTKEL